MNENQAWMLVAIIVYMGVLIWIGVYFSRKNSSTNDFYLGGRKLGPFVTAMSAEASDMSSYLLMGLPGLAYLTGLADVTWTAIGLAVGTYLNWLIVAKRLRNYSEICKDSITIPDFFSNRYRDNKKILMCVAAAIIIVFFVPYTASGFKACGVLFSSVFGIDYAYAMLISAVIIIAYTTLGGFLAASFSDFIQSIIMTIALVTVLFVGISFAGGFDKVIENAQSNPGYLGMFTTFDPSTGTSNPYTGLTIVSTMAWGLGYFGMPHVLLRFMAIKDNKKLKLSRRIASVWVVISMGIAILIGIVGAAMSANGSIEVLEGGASESVIIQIAKLIASYGWAFALFGGVVLAGILAATMSTSDSQLLAASSSISENILKGTFKLNLSKRATMIIARLTVIGVAIVAVLLALDQNSTVFGIVSFAWAGFGATFGPVMLLALFWKRSNFWGAITGMITGGAMVFIWEYVLTPLGGIFGIYELLPAFILALVVNVIVSLVTKAPDEEIVKEFEHVKAMQKAN